MNTSKKFEEIRSFSFARQPIYTISHYNRLSILQNTLFLRVLFRVNATVCNIEGTILS